MARRMLFLIFVAIGCLAIANADPIVWTGDPVINQQVCNGCPYQGPGDLEINTNGDSQSASAGVSFGTTAWAADSSGYFSVQIPFTVTADSMIQIDLTAGYGASGYNCPAIGCFPQTSWSLEGEFSGTVGVDGLAPVSLSASGSQPGVCSNGACEGGVTLSEPASETVFLQAGNYLFDVSMSGDNSSAGDSQAGLGLEAFFSAPLSPVPEPYYEWMSGLVLLGIVFGRRFSRRSIKV